MKYAGRNTRQVAICEGDAPKGEYGIRDGGWSGELPDKRWKDDM
ncbi:MAG: hypothetical protein AAFZ15_09850 [Bacteroidota bacterium]